MSPPEQPQADLVRQPEKSGGVELERVPSAQGPSDKLFSRLADASTRARPRARRTRLASSASALRRQPSRASAGIDARSRGARETRIAVGGIVGIGNARLAQGRDQPRLRRRRAAAARSQRRTVRFRAPCRRGRTSRCRAPAGTGWSRPGRRAYARSAHGASPRLPRFLRQQRVARVARGFLQAGLRLAPGPAQRAVRDAKLAAPAVPRRSPRALIPARSP